MAQWNVFADVLSILVAIRKGYDYTPGDSDLDNEQHIWVKMTLGDWRKANLLAYEVEKTV